MLQRVKGALINITPGQQAQTQDMLGKLGQMAATHRVGNEEGLTSPWLSFPPISSLG